MHARSLEHTTVKPSAENWMVHRLAGSSVLREPTSPSSTGRLFNGQDHQLHFMQRVFIVSLDLHQPRAPALEYPLLKPRHSTLSRQC